MKKPITFETTGADLPPDALALAHLWTDDVQRIGVNRWVLPAKAHIVAIVQESPGTFRHMPNDFALALLAAAVDMPHTSSYQLSCGGDCAQWALVRREGRARKLRVLMMRGRGTNTGE